MTTLVPRAPNTFNGHPKIKHEKLHMSFPLLLHMAYLSQLTRLLVKFLLYNAWSPTYLLEHTMATNHGLLGKDEALTIYCIIALHFYNHAAHI